MKHCPFETLPWGGLSFNNKADNAPKNIYSFPLDWFSELGYIFLNNFKGGKMPS